MAISLAVPGRQISVRAISFYASPALPWAIIGVGILFRLAQYLRNRSLSIDEAALALNISSRSFAQLWGTLDYLTGAPVGFLMLTKLSTVVLGNSELALRLVPFLSGIGSLLLFYFIAKNYIAPRAVPIALAIFAASTSLVLYSSFLKQYSGDVLVTLLILLVTLRVTRSGLSARWLAVYGLAGGTLIWFSHPLPLVLAGFGLTLGIWCIASKNWTKLAQIAVVAAVWMASFAFSFQTTPTGELVNDAGLVGKLASFSGFIPSQPLSLQGANWFTNTMFDLFRLPGGLILVGLTALSFVVGIAAVKHADPFRLVLLISPVVVTALVSIAQLYPFSDRWVLFLTPFVILFIAEGANSIAEKTRSSYPMLGGVLIALLLLHPLASEGFRLIEPRGTEEIRDVMEYVRVRRTDTDLVYVYTGAQRAFEYYADRIGFAEGEYIEGVSGGGPGLLARDLNKFAAEMDQLRGNSRVWLIFSHVGTVMPAAGFGEGINEEQFYIYYLDNLGTKVDSFRSQEASAYLYDLSDEAGP